MERAALLQAAKDEGEVTIASGQLVERFENRRGTDVDVA